MKETQYLMGQLFNDSRPGILTNPRSGILTGLGSFSIGPYTFAAKSPIGAYRGILTPRISTDKYRGAVRPIKRRKGKIKGRFAAYAHEDGTTEISDEVPEILLPYVMAHEEMEHRFPYEEHGEKDRRALDLIRDENFESYLAALRVERKRWENRLAGIGDPEDDRIIDYLMGTEYRDEILKAA